LPHPFWLGLSSFSSLDVIEIQLPVRWLTEPAPLIAG